MGAPLLGLPKSIYYEHFPVNVSALKLSVFLANLFKQNLYTTQRLLFSDY